MGIGCLYSEKFKHDIMQIWAFLKTSPCYYLMPYINVSQNK